MRGIGLTLSRLSAARALLAGAAILAGTSLRSAGAQTAEGTTGLDEVALAVPRLGPPTGGPQGGIALPQPLAPSEAARVRRILALQARGDVPAALAETAQLTDPLLLPTLLADRYLRDPARTSAADLSGWLARNAALPDAPAIHALLLARLPRHVPAPPAPPAATLGAETAASPTPEEEDPAEHALARNELLDRTVAARVAAGNAPSALSLIARTRGLDPVYRAQLRAEVAQSLFAQGDDVRALAVAQEAFRASGGRVGLAGFVGGLAAWRLDRPALARSLFEAASRSALLPASTRAGAAFWAARAHLRVGDPLGWRPWMVRAAAQRRTFYGLLAGRVLGQGRPHDADWTPDVLSEADLDAVGALPGGRRAFALLQVGEPARAEAELRRLWPAVGGDLALGRSIMLVAQAGGLTGLAAQLATLVQEGDGRPRDAARFPVPRLAPRGGFLLDRALVYALARLESNFDPQAVSAAGAQGLMQIMPVTAGFVLGDPDRFTGSPARLHDPALNLQLGQRYVLYLARHDAVAGNLVRLLAAYNAGPGALGRWDVRGGSDPLMFMEGIPLPETRGFVHRALTYVWIYAERLDLPAPSLDALAGGNWPGFGDPRVPEHGATVATWVH